MQKDKLITILTNLGLSENESKVYLAALVLGASSILGIAKAAEINRTTAYAIIDSLQKKGLMNIEISGLKKRFIAEDPEKLENILEIKRQQLKNVLPDFSALYSRRGGGSTIKYYEGIEAIKSVYDKMLDDLRSKEYYYAISDTKRWHEFDPEYIEHFLKQRAKLPIDVRLLLQDSDIAQRHLKFARNYKEKVKILAKGIVLTTNLIVTPHYIVIHQLTHPVSAIVIKNPGAVQMGKQLFDIIWASMDDDVRNLTQ